MTVDQVIAASRLEEEFQVEIWGVVEGGHDMDRLNNAVNLSAAGLFYGLITNPVQHNSLIEKWRRGQEREDSNHSNLLRNEEKEFVVDA